MKKFEAMSCSLSKTEMKNVMGGVDTTGCTLTWAGSNGSGSSQTCDYVASGGDRCLAYNQEDTLCYQECLPGCSGPGQSCHF